MIAFNAGPAIGWYPQAAIVALITTWVIFVIDPVGDGLFGSLAQLAIRRAEVVARAKRMRFIAVS
jgi:hypothetical protein